MKTPRVIYISKSKLYPAFGDADIKKQIAHVRKDLPKSVKKYVKQHELYHLKDNTKNWVWREIKASIYGAIKHPIGALICLIMTLAPCRLKFYWQRIKRGY